MTKYCPTTRIASITTLALALGLASPPASAAEGDVDVVIQLRNDPTPEDEDGSCSVCRVLALTGTAASSHEQAVFKLYYADEGEDIEADLVFTVLLESNEFRTIIVSDVDLHDETTETFVVPSGYDWSWNDVKHSWVEVEPVS